MKAEQAVTVPFQNLALQHQPLRDQFLRAFGEALDTGTFIGGQQVLGFEDEFAAFCGAKACAGVGSGTDALRLALQALGVTTGDLVLTVPNTFIATTEAVSQAGARFAFVDVDQDTSLMDLDRLEDELKRRFGSGRAEDRPRAVIPVHLYGQCVDMNAVASLAARYEMLVLEDAAQAHGASQQGLSAGTLGHAAAFSFYPGKNLGALGEAGAVTTGDASVAATVRMLRDHGQSQKYHHRQEGANARLDALQAAFLRLKLRHLEPWNERRRTLARRYDAAFADLPWLRPVAIAPGNVPARHLYVIHTRGREALAAHLARHGVQTGLHYPIPLHLQQCYAGLNHRPGDFPVAERLAGELLTLPLFPEMTGTQLEHVIATVRQFEEA
ncbi:MAG: hypothetical protein A2051_07735 [Desulfovibrionales bacterium GWA2_65_9]|nr:MAG: hypothetical protein A2051_07735 [Desulfovibrionales bacterium GWA2_65_9]